MITPEDAVVAAAVAWSQANPPGLAEIFSDELQPLRDAVAALLAAREPRPLTWGQVPAGWEVQAPDGQWYRVTHTYQRGLSMPKGQRVTLEGLGAWDRDPAGPVTARPGASNPTDAAIAAFGYPEILEDGS